ncbi:MAG TPA: rhodanese family protein [Pseudolabrys sp.]|nr:rhodanese family protein [Pseudolabrys sp.]
MPSLTSITAERAAELVRSGATLVDIRGADEYAREHIAGARHAPMTTVNTKLADETGIVVFHCRSGARTQANATQLARAAGHCEAYLLEGGLDAWKKAGLPIIRDHKQPIELMRQVQIAAGVMVLLGAALGTFVAPGFYALSAAVGTGLIFAGATGFCGMARLLRHMPWNRQAAAS